MKRILTALVVLFTFVSSFAASNTLNYQAIVREANGNLAVDSKVGVRFRILDSNSQALYTEEATVTTDGNGLFGYAIGTKGDLSVVGWEQTGLRLEVSIDTAGGQNYTSTYVSDINSVATSLYSEHSGDTETVMKDLAQTQMMLEDVRTMMHAVSYETDAKLKEMQNRSEYNRQLIEENRTRIEDLMAIVNDLNIRIETAYGRINNMENDIVTMKTLIDIMEERIKKLEEK